MRSRIRSQKGIALPLVLLFVIVLILLGFGLSIFGYYEATSAIREEHLAKAFYIARGSVAALTDYLTKIPGDVTENNIQEYQEDVSTFVDELVSHGIKGFYEAGGTISPEGLSNFVITAKSYKDTSTKTGRLELTSVGTSGKFTREASIQLKYSLTEYKPFGLVDCALFTKSTANADEKLSNDYKVDVISGKIVAYNDPLDPNTPSEIQRDIHVDPLDPAWPDILAELRNYRIPRKLEFTGTEKGAVVINGDTVWSNSASKSAPTIYHCNSLTIKSGSLRFNNPGVVYLIVDNGLDINGKIGCTETCNLKSTPAVHSANCWLGRVNIIYMGSNDIKIGGNAYIRANIISLRADISMDITAIGTPTLSGHIVAGTTGTITFGGNFENAPSMIYAPNATVIVKGSASVPDFYGSVICDVFNPNSHFEIRYERIPRSSLPIWYGADATGYLDEEDNLGTDEYYITNLISDRWL